MYFTQISPLGGKPVPYILQNGEKAKSYIEALEDYALRNPYNTYTEAEVFHMAQEELIKKLKRERELKEIKKANKSLSENKSMSIK